MKMRTCVMMMVFGVAFLLWAAGAGAIPQEINYQGKLTDPSGKPLTESQSIVFTIYDTDEGGTDLWTETRTVPVSKGIFNVILGEKTPIPTEVFNGDERWLGIKVGSDAEMTPRAKIVSVGNAFHANTADSIGGQSLSDFVLKSGDTMGGPLTVEAAIAAEGLRMGSAESSATLNRVHINFPGAPNNNAVVNVGGEMDGSMLMLGSPPNIYSAQIFGQARNDDTALAYVGIWGKSDRNRNGSEQIGVLGEAYGASTSNGLLPIALAGLGGTPSQPIGNIGLFTGYTDSFALVAENMNSAGGGGLFVASSNETGSIFEADYGSDPSSSFHGIGFTRYFRIYRGAAGDRPQVKLENNTALILDSGSSIEMTNGNITTGGYVSAETYYGDGSNLTGLPGGPGGSYIAKTGDTMGQVLTAESSTNRFRYNMPDGFTPGINSVISVGGEYDGGANGNSAWFPAGSISTQIFGQARNDGTASGGIFGGIYAGVIGMADANEDAYDAIGLTGIAYGPGSFGGVISAGDPTTSSYGGLLIGGYMNGFGLQVNNSDPTGTVADFTSNGSDILSIDNAATHFNAPAYFGGNPDGVISTWLDETEQNNLALWGRNGYNNYPRTFPNILANGGGWDINCGGGGGSPVSDGLNVYYAYGVGDGESFVKLFEAPPAGSSAFLSGYAEDASDAVGIIFDNVNSLGTDGAKLISIRNAGYEVAYVDKDGVYHSASGSTEGGSFISKTGDTMGTVEASTSFNRFRFNMPEGFTAGNHSVLSLGGEFDGSIVADPNTPADSWSSQLFCQARDDGTSSVGVYAGIWGKSDFENGNGAGIVGEAYGPDWGAAGILPTTIMGFGGTDATPIANLGYFEGYADAYGLQVNNWNGTGGGGLLVNSNSDGAPVANFTYGATPGYMFSGTSVLYINNYGSYFYAPAWFGDGNIAGYNDGGSGSGVNLGIYGRDSTYNNILATPGGGWAMNCESGDGLNVYTNSSGNSPLTLRVPGSGSSALLSGYADDASNAVAIVFDNVNPLSTAGAKLLSINNASVEVTYVDKDGSMSLGESGNFDYRQAWNATLYFCGPGNGELISGRVSEEADGPGLVLQGNNSASGQILPAVAIRDLTPNTAEGQDLCRFETWQYGENWMWVGVAGIKDDGGAWFNGKVDASAAGIKMWYHHPSGSDEVGATGLTCYDDNYFYVWVADDHVKRAALSDW